MGKLLIHGQTSHPVKFTSAAGQPDLVINFPVTFPVQPKGALTAASGFLAQDWSLVSGPWPHPLAKAGSREHPYSILAFFGCILNGLRSSHSPILHPNHHILWTTISLEGLMNLNLSYLLCLK
jgi:hypothetical protein